MILSLTKISDNLSDAEHQENFKKINALGINGIEISGFGGSWGPTWDANRNYGLNFLKFYKGIKALRIYLHGTVDINPILELADSLEHLHLGEFFDKKVNLNFLRQLTKLKSISAVRNLNGLDSIASLKNITDLALTGYPITKMSFLNELTTLSKLYIGFGTSDNLNNIDRLINVEDLSILWVKKLSNIDGISNLQKLKKLKIEDEKQIATLPDFSKPNDLKNIRLMNLGSLQDISSLTQSSVEEFILTGPNKNVEILNSLKNSIHPQKVYTSFYSKKAQTMAKQILGEKFCPLSNMKFEMKDAVSVHYYDLNTGNKIS